MNQLYEVIKAGLIAQRERKKQSGCSKAGSLTMNMENWIKSEQEDAKCANVIKQMIRQSTSKAGSVISGVNKVQAIHDFISSGGRII